MFGLFNKKNPKKTTNIPFIDLNGNTLQEGDHVLSHRYDLGKCVIKAVENGFEYESIETGKRVNWVLMIDAATERQKVEKIE